MPGQGLQVDYAEAGLKEGTSSVETVDLDGGEAVRQIIVADEDRFDAYWQLIGYSYKEGNQLRRYLPDRHPEMENAVCVSVRSERLGYQTTLLNGTGQTFARYRKAKLTCRYAAVPWNVLGDDEITVDGVTSEFFRNCVYEAEIDGDYLSIPVSGVFHYSEGPNAFPSDKSTFPGNPGVITPYANIRVCWKQIPDPALPEGVISYSEGRVNSVDFGFPGAARLFYPAGELLFLGASWKRIYMPYLNLPGWDVNYNFRHVQAGGPNKLIDFKTPTPDRTRYQVTRTGTHYDEGSIPDGETIHGETDLFDLFVPYN